MGAQLVGALLQVRATAVLGVPTTDRIIYDNLDLLVHPMTVSFTDSQLTQLWVPPPPSNTSHPRLHTQTHTQA